MVTPDLSSLWWLAPLAVWDLVWKAIGMWKAARHNQRAWFVAILILNTVGILPILYIRFFQREGM